MPLWQWSTTAANNATAGTINWAEGQPPSTVNDSARQMMADVATWFQNPEWLNYGLTPTYVSATQFTLAGNQTAIYSVGRRVRAFVTAGIIYGSISVSAYTSLTTVTVTWDGSASLDNGLSEVDVGFFNPINSSFPLSQYRFSSIVITNSNGLYSGVLMLVGQGGYSPTIRANGASSQLEWVNSPNTAITMTLTDSGNLTASGTITANSDERLKQDWESLPDDFVKRLSTIRSGTYMRIDTEQRQAGVGAQSLQALLPEAVLESDNGILSVAYGQAAMVACVELAKEVMRLRELVEAK
jgi:hypothetical protein